MHGEELLLHKNKNRFVSNEPSNKTNNINKPSINFTRKIINKKKKHSSLKTSINEKMIYNFQQLKKS